MLAISLATGCVRGDGRYIAYGGEVALTGLGLALASVDTEDPDDDYVNETPLRQGIVNVGLAMMAVGVGGFVATYLANDRDEPPRPPAPDPASLSPVPAFAWANPEAVRLTRQARNAAVIGACTAVRQLAPRVLQADAAYHRNVFLLDAAIVACL